MWQSSKSNSILRVPDTIVNIIITHTHTESCLSGARLVGAATRLTDHPTGRFLIRRMCTAALLLLLPMLLLTSILMTVRRCMLAVPFLMLHTSRRG